MLSTLLLLSNVLRGLHCLFLHCAHNGLQWFKPLINSEYVSSHNFTAKYNYYPC